MDVTVFSVLESALFEPTMPPVAVHVDPSEDEAALMVPAELSMSYATTAFGTLEPSVLSMSMSPLLLVTVKDKPVDTEPLAVIPATVDAAVASVATVTAPLAASDTAMKIEFPDAAGANATLLAAPMEPSPVTDASDGAGSESDCGMIAAQRPLSVRTNRYDEVPACAQ